MKNPLADILREARKWAAEKHQEYLDSMTPQQMELIARMNAEAAKEAEATEEQKEAKSYVYPKEGRNWVIHCMTARLCSNGFTPDEADLIAKVSVKPEETTPEERERAAELNKRSVKREKP